jgi:hypothetical protein
MGGDVERRTGLALLPGKRGIKSKGNWGFTHLPPSIPDSDVAIDRSREIEDIDDLSTQIDKLSNQRAFKQKCLWAKLWSLPIEFGEE